jgi:four helix bundle protein
LATCRVGTFRDLAVYRRSVLLSDALHRCVAGWSSFDRWTVGVQLVRSVDSIGANIAEAAGRESNPDQRRFLVTARASVLEVQHWLDRARERGLPIPPDAERDAVEIGRMVNGLVKTRT